MFLGALFPAAPIGSLRKGCQQCTGHDWAGTGDPAQQGAQTSCRWPRGAPKDAWLSERGQVQSGCWALGTPLSFPHPISALGGRGSRGLLGEGPGRAEVPLGTGLALVLSWAR